MSEYAELAAYLEQRIASSEDPVTVIFAGMVDEGLIAKAIQLLKKADADKRSLRDEFAGKALISLVKSAENDDTLTPRDYADSAYVYADAMLAARRQETK